MTDRNKRLIELWVDVINRKDWSMFDQVWGSEVAVHAAGTDITSAHDAATLRETFRPFFEELPDVRVIINQLIAEGDFVVGRFSMKATNDRTFMGHPPSGRVLEWVSHNVYRIKDDRIVEEWVLDDMLTLMRGIGAVVPA